MGATVLAAALIGSALTLSGGVPSAQAVTGDTGTKTSVVRVSGKAEGSGHWGVVGNVQTWSSTSGSVFNYDLEFSPTDGSLWVSDSGKAGWGLGGCWPNSSPCQLGNPRVFKYDQLSTDWTLGQYLVDGNFGAAPAGANAGIGANWQNIADRTSISAPFSSTTTPNMTNGPRGIAFTADGQAFVVNSEGVAPWGGAPGTVKVFDASGALTDQTGWTGTWSQRENPGVMFYPVGAATTLEGNIIVTSQTSDRLVEYSPSGDVVRVIKLDLPAGSAFTGDPGYRDPYAVTVDPNNGDLIIGYNTNQAAFGSPGATTIIERRDSTGTTVKTVYRSTSLQNRSTVMAVAVHPVTGNVFGWTQTGNVIEWAPDGTQLRLWRQGDAPVSATNNPNNYYFPDLSFARGLTFDEGGRMYFTVREGTSAAKVVILGQTPVPVSEATGVRSADGATVELNWGIDAAAQAALENGLGGLPIKDYLVEQSSDGGATWSIAAKPSASTALNRTITGLDATLDYYFRISAWNEAGNGDWLEVCPPRAPIANPDSVTEEIGVSPITIEVLANDVDGTGAAIDPATANLVLVDDSDPANLVYTTTLTVAGEGTYTVVDGKIEFTPDAAVTSTTTLTPVPYAVGAGIARSQSTLQVTLLKVGIALTKTGVTAEPAVVGNDIEWTLIVSNDGDVDLTNVAIDDPAIGDATIAWTWPGAEGTLLVGESATGKVTTKLTAEDIAAKLVSNSASASATTPKGQEVTAAANADVDLILPNSANPDTATGEIGGGDLTIDVLANDRDGDGNPIDPATANLVLVDNTDAANPAHVTTLTIAGEGTYTVVDGKIVFSPDAAVTSTTTLTPVTYAVGEGTMRVTSTVTVTLLQVGVSITKTGVAPSPAAVDGEVVWTITVQNTGAVALSEVTVTDAAIGDATIDWTWPGEAGTLLVGESATGKVVTKLTADDIAAKLVTNTASVSGLTPGGQTVTAETSVDVALTLPVSPQETEPPVSNPIETPVATGAIPAPTAPNAAPLAVTGAGDHTAVLIGGLVLVALGGVLIARRRQQP